MTAPVQDALDWTPRPPDPTPVVLAAAARVDATLDTDSEPTCERPPRGWMCTRLRGHTGSCASLPLIPRTDPTPVVLAAVHNDPLPSRQTDRQHIEAAVVRAAVEHGGLVTAAWVRPYITRDVWPQMIGQVLRPRAGFLEPTGRHPERNGGGSGNANKWSNVYRYVGPTPITR